MPENDALVGEFVALLTIETLPLIGPDALGKKVRLKPVDCPGASVSGTESPLILNSLPITFAWEIVTLPVPTFVRVTTTAPWSPSTTLPKLVLVGLPESRSVTPVPDNDTFVGELVALLVIETLPATLPDAVGVKVVLKVALWPAVRIRGSEGPLTPKPAPLTVVCKIVTGAIPVLLTLKVWLLALPTVTLPKFKLLGAPPQVATPCTKTSETHTDCAHTTIHKNVLGVTVFDRHVEWTRRIYFSARLNHHKAINLPFSLRERTASF